MNKAVLALLLLAGGCQKPKEDKDPSGAGKAAKTATADYHVKRLANEGYVNWSAEHAPGECPSSVEQVARIADTLPEDPWGNPYFLFCGEGLPAGAKGFAVMSFGPDGQRDTDDDILSWK